MTRSSDSFYPAVEERGVGGVGAVPDPRCAPRAQDEPRPFCSQHSLDLTPSHPSGHLPPRAASSRQVIDYLFPSQFVPFINECRRYVKLGRVGAGEGSAWGRRIPSPWGC